MRRIFFALAFVAAIFSLAPTALAAPPSAAEVQLKVLAKLKANAAVAKATLRADGCIDALLKTEKEPRVICTDNLALLIKNSDLPDSVIDDFVERNALAKIDTGPAQISLLKAAWPVMRATETLDAFDAGLTSGKDPTRLVRDAFAADVSVAYVFDIGQGMRYATEKDLTEMGASHAALTTAAMKNLSDATGETRWERSGNAMLADFDANYNSSLIMLDDLWPEIEKQLGGPIAVGIPSRDSIIAVRTDDAAAVAEIRAAMNHDYAYAISSKLFKRENGKWVEFK